jgi:transcriptional regulator with XRE-family HTH domain
MESKEKRRLAFRKQVADEVAVIDLRQLAKDLCDKGFRDAYLDDSLAWAIRTQIRLIREDRGWTQEELAEKSSVSYATINRLENMDAPVCVQIGTLLKLAEAFDCALIVRFEAWSEYLTWLAEVKATAGASLIPQPFATTISELERWAEERV